MPSYQLRPREIPLDDSYDVIVIGGGPSGCTAAAAAARDGARTLLIESTGCLGGMGTMALVPAWCPFSDKEQIIYKGLAEKVFTTLKSQMPHVPEKQLDWVPIDAERLKRVYDDLVLDHGAKILFNTLLASVEKGENGSVDAILCANKAGLTAYKAKVYIDCTGDGDVAAWAGAEYHKGNDDETDPNLMPATHCFVLTNVDDYVYRTGNGIYASNPNSPIYKVLESGKYPLIPDAHICNNTVGPGAVGFNAGHLWHVDNTKPETISEALVAGRKMAAQYRDGLAEYHPAFANCFLALTGSLMGIRETRRIIGDYVLTLEDYLARQTFDDEICRNSYFIDVHPGVKDAFRNVQQLKGWENTTIHFGPGESHGIPYRCLTPKGLRNVLVAGRSISCEQIVQGSVRVMPVCLAMGEAAGAAAAQAIATGDYDIHAVDVDRLRTRLREAGGYLPETETGKVAERELAAVTRV